MITILLIVNAVLGALIIGFLFKAYKHVLGDRGKNKISIGSIYSECWWVAEDILTNEECAKELFVIVCR